MSLLPFPLRLRPPLTLFTRALSVSSPLSKSRPLPPRPKISESDITEVFVKGSGPGGQKINKTSSAVQLKHLPTGIVVKSQATRSREQNRTIARRVLAEKVEALEKGAESRVEKKRELAVKRKKSAGKKKRRKYRKLQEEKGEGAAIGERDETGVDEDEAAVHGGSEVGGDARTQI